MNFPNPVLLPQHVFQNRQERLKQLVSSSLKGVAIRLTIILGELGGVWLFGSASLLMDAFSSFLDVLSSVFLIICIKLAARPPDANHPFGHGRFEPLVGLQLGLLMALLGCGLFVQQLFAIARVEESKVIDPRAWLIALAAVVLLEISYQITMRAAKGRHSPALLADALHYRLDGFTSMCAAIALAIGAYFPSWSGTMDHIGAVFIALIMVAVGAYAFWQNLHQIVDRIPDQQYFERVRNVVGRVEGVLGTEKIRIQLSGPDAHVDIDVEVDPILTVEVAHAISQQVRAAIQKEWPAVQDVTVHIEPYYPGDH